MNFILIIQKNTLREIPLMTNDGIVIPKEGLYESFKNPTDPTIPVIAGSNRDEVKLWILEQHFILFNLNILFLDQFLAYQGLKL